MGKIKLYLIFSLGVICFASVKINAQSNKLTELRIVSISRYLATGLPWSVKKLEDSKYAKVSVVSERDKLLNFQNILMKIKTKKAKNTFVDARMVCFIKHEDGSVRTLINNGGNGFYIGNCYYKDREGSLIKFLWENNLIKKDWIK